MAQPSAPDEADLDVGGEVEMQSLLSLPGTRCFRIIQGQRTSLGNGELNICMMDDNTLLLYIPGVFQYAITKQFPSLRASKYSFVFPGHNHMCFGVILSIHTPTEDIDMFEGLLTEYSIYQLDYVQSDDEPSDTTDEQKEEDTLTKDQKIAKKGQKVAKLIKKSSQLATKGIQKGTEYAGKGIRGSKEYLKKKIKSRKDIKVSEKTAKRIKTAKTMSAAAVKVSGAALAGAKVMCSELAASASKAVSETEWGQKFANSQDGKIQAVKSVGKATLSGTLEIIDELHNAAIILVSEMADSSADLARYKYGDGVGDAADDAADVVKSGTHIVKNVVELGYKPMIKAVAAHGAHDLMSTEEEKVENAKQRRDKALESIDGNMQSVANVVIENELSSNASQKYNV